MPTRMRRLVDVAVWKDASNVRLFRYEAMVLTRYEGKLRIVSLWRRPSTHSFEGLSHIEENRACYSLLVKVPGYSFYKMGEL